MRGVISLNKDQRAIKEKIFHVVSDEIKEIVNKNIRRFHFWKPEDVEGYAQGAAIINPDGTHKIIDERFVGDERLEEFLTLALENKEVVILCFE